MLCAFALRVAFLDVQSLWWDEVKTVFRATIPVDEMLADIVRKKGHMPLYFLLMQGWLKLGEVDFIIRYFSVLWGTIGVALLYQLGFLIGKRPLAQLAAFLLAISPFHIWYSQEARMYSMVPALVIASTLFLMLGLRHNRKIYWIGYCLMMVTAVYTHYFTLLVLFSHSLFFALHFRAFPSRAIRWLMASGIVGLLFSLYVLLILNNGGYQNATPGWIQPINWYEPILTLLTFSAGRTIIPTHPLPVILLLILLVGLIFSFVSLPQPAHHRESTNLRLRLLKLWFIIPLLIIYLVSQGWQNNFSIYIDRYLIIILPAYLLLVGYGLIQLHKFLNKTWLSMVALLIILILTATSLQNLYLEPQFARNDMRQATQFLIDRMSANDAVVGTADIQLPLAYYANTEAEQMLFVELPIDFVDSANAPLFEQAMAIQIEKAVENGGDIWYLGQLLNHSPHGFANNTLASADLRKGWLSENLAEQGHWSFPGGINLYYFSTFEETK